MSTQFAIEESSLSSGYKRVHKAGCRDLRDPEPVNSEPTPDALLDALDGYEVAATLEQLRPMIAPCARELMG